MDTQVEHQQILVNDSRRQKQSDEYELALNRKVNHRTINNIQQSAQNPQRVNLQKDEEKNLFNEQLIEGDNESKNRILRSLETSSSEDRGNVSSSSDSSLNLAPPKKIRKGEYKSRESEQRRRDRINEGLTKLKDLLPAKNQTKKKKKVEIILEAAQHIEELKTMCNKLSNENQYLKRNLNEFDNKIAMPQEKIYNMNVMGNMPPTSMMQLSMDDSSMNTTAASVPQSHKRKYINMDGQHMPVVPNNLHTHMGTPQYHIQNSNVQQPSQYQNANGGPADFPTSLQIDNNNLFALRALQSFSPFGNTVPTIPNSLHVSGVPQNQNMSQTLNWHPSLFHGYANSHIPPINLTPTNNSNTIYGNSGTNQHVQPHGSVQPQQGDAQNQSNGPQPTIGYQNGSSSDSTSNVISNDSPPSPTSSSSSSDNAV
jgi:hypothetical protein